MPLRTPEPTLPTSHMDNQSVGTAGHSTAMRIPREMPAHPPGQPKQVLRHKHRFALGGSPRRLQLVEPAATSDDATAQDQQKQGFRHKHRFSVGGSPRRLQLVEPTSVHSEAGPLLTQLRKQTKDSSTVSIQEAQSLEPTPVEGRSGVSRLSYLASKVSKRDGSGARVTRPAHALRRLSGQATLSRSSKQSYPPTSWRYSQPVGQDCRQNQYNGGGRPHSLDLSRLSKPAESAARRASSPGSDADSGVFFLDPPPSYSVSAPSVSVKVDSEVHPALREQGKQSPTSPASANKPTLPDPTVVYARPYHFTGCPHTHPPKSRPLNVQPVFVWDCDGLEGHTPAPHDTCEATDNGIWIIDGACHECDWSARRTAESNILKKYADREQDMSLQLSDLERDVAQACSNEPMLGGAMGEEDFAALERRVADFVEQTNIHSRSDALRTRQMEREVKAVWKGYQETWGPAALGIYRGKHDETETGSTPTPTKSSSNGQPRSGVTFSRRTPGSTRPVVARGLQERYSDGTSAVAAAVDPSVDGVGQAGRMELKWHNQ